ncbi:hypothetical protein EPUS_05645 [Endocarpon pusillum Z07020]|uniref:Uncharacterized protein n=1 Tax=Endocarpon pusillum (strain Z07020 / HMAS-L-300199) TaxID=1263415 RepID=U1G9Z1_ENDPU|nr:uncharacterized protein EPUS_05645 [Endocarpon pusillum Z07020]ERF68506.1 hypothetical protein EPUS_05645 [Endocarpon pusillum Z07020]
MDGKYHGVIDAIQDQLCIPSTFYYLPIYFQWAEGISAATSDIGTVPYDLPINRCNAPRHESLGQLLTFQAFGVITADQTIFALGHAVPWMVLGLAFTAVGLGLIYTFNVGSPAKILGVTEGGVRFQMPIMIMQATTREQDVLLATAILRRKCDNCWVGAPLVSQLYRRTFHNSLLKQPPITAPNIDPIPILHPGTTQLEEIVPVGWLDGALKAYVAGFREILVIAVAFTGATFISAFEFRFLSIRQTMMAEVQNS